MSVTLNNMIFYIVSVVVTIGGFATILRARTTLALAVGVIMIIIGLVVFLVGQERARSTVMVRRR